MKNLPISIPMILAYCFLTGCTAGDYSSSAGNDSGSGGSSTIDTQIYAVSVAEEADTYDEADIVSNISFDYDVMLDFTNGSVQIDSGQPQALSSAVVSLLTDEAGTLTVSWTDNGVDVASSVSGRIRYTLTGTLDDSLIIESDTPCELYLKDVTINGLSGPALDIASSEKTFIVTADGSENVLSDDEDRSDEMDMKASLYGAGPLVFSGGGELTVEGGYKHGIYSKDYIRIREGTLNVNVTARDGIRSKNGFIFDDGTLAINAVGNVSDDESKGIKVEGSEDNPGEGFIVINGGTLDITSVSKGMTASWDVEDDCETADTADDPDPYVQINNGIISVVTTGTPYEYSTGESCSPEGIEGKSFVEINDGYLTIRTADDCLNAGESIEINDGYIYAVSSENDAVDSNGTLTINGGVIVAVGASSPEGSFDCDQNTFAVSGGTFVGIGGSYSTPTSSSCTQNVVLLGSGAADDVLGIVSSGGDRVFVYSIPSDYSKMILSSPGIETGSTYIVYTGGTGSGDNDFYGLCLENLAYSDGSEQDDFTVNSAVTTVGSGGNDHNIR